MKIARCSTALVVLCLFFTVSGATISSTTTGGLWGDAATWVGGVVPGASDDVIINGPVSVEGAKTCASVTVASGAILQNGGGLGWVVLTVTNTTTNGGTIRNNPAANELWIECNGNIVNNGVWMPARTFIPTLKTQTISQAAGTEFRGSFIGRKNNAGYSDTFALVAASDIVINTPGFDGNSYATSVQYYWGKMDMAGHNLTLKGGTPMTGTVVVRAGVFTCGDSSSISSFVIDSAVTLAGRFTVTGGNMTFNGQVTVRDTLQNGGGLGWVTPRFNGKIINNGLIRNNPLGKELWLDLYSDITNNGVWTPARTFIPTMKTQTISLAAGKEFSGSTITRKNSAGYSDTFVLTAASDLVFNAGNFDNNAYGDSVKYFWGIINMAGHNLTLKGGTPMTGFVLRKAGVFSCTDSSAVSNFVIDSAITLGGRFTLTGGGMTFNGQVTVRDTLQNGGGLGWVTPRFNGKIINNGLIRNNPLGKELWLDLYGDITNNGTWTPARTFIPTMKTQTISLAAGKEFSGSTITRKNSAGYSDTFNLVAASDLVFNTGNFDCNAYSDSVKYFWGRLNMAGYNLTLRGGTPMTGFVLRKAGVFTCSDSSAVSNFVIDSAVTLAGHFTVTGGGMTFNNQVTVRDTLQNGGGLGWVTAVSNSRIINLGLIRNNPKGNELWINTYGDIETYGTFACGRLYVVNTGRTAVLSGAIDASTTLDVETGKTPGLVRAGPGLIFRKQLTVNTGKTLEIPQSGECTIEAGVSGGGALVNKGVLRQRLAPLANGAQPLAGAMFIGMRVQDKGTADTVRVTASTGTVHPALASSVRRWWRITNDDTLKSYSIVLTYADSLLNGNNEKTLEVYLTKDNGTTWTKISTPINVTRDTVANTIAVGSDAQPIGAGTGDIVLSSGGIVIPPSISTSIIGRTDIRVGPPNRYTIAYWNNSATAPASPFFITLKTGGGIFFRAAEVNSLDSHKVYIPRDSLLFDTADAEVLFYVTGLAPNELRTFDVILTADRSYQAKNAMIEPFLTVAAIWLVTSVVEEYASNYLVSACYEMWRPYEQGTDFKTLVTEGAYHTYKRTNADFNVKEAVGKKVAEGVVKGVEKSIGRTIASPLFLAKDVLDCMKNMVNGMKDYVNGNFDKNERTLRKVTSWDPNFKAGPAGYGSKGYLATAAPVTYTIFFENKKEATAAAYTVTVRDTLDASVFDTSSVSFGPMSHSMGVAKKAGNVLSWEFDSIELPPNVNPPEGEGFVQFTVRPRAGLTTGTELKNTAVIVFDINPPLATNTALNTLDFNAPKTDSARAVFVGGDSVDVSFVATDSGSGVKTSNVFVSYDNAPFTLAGSTGTGKMRIKARSGALCRFYVLSQDSAGNTEKTGAIFEATPVVRGQGAAGAALSFLRVKPAFAGKIPIAFSLASDSRVQLRVYDLRGRRIATIVDGNFKAGGHSFVWSARNVSSGTYCVRMSAGSFRAQQKLFVGR